MFRKTVSAIMLSLLVISTLTLAFKIQIAKADGGTIYINTDGSISPPTAPISTFDNVTYFLFANITDCSIVVERDNIVLDGNGYTLQGAGSGIGTGIDLTGTTNVKVQNTTITAFAHGISVGSYSLALASYSSIDGNNITNCDDGIYVDSSYSSIDGNNITNNIYGILVFFFTSNNSISGNNFTANTYGGIFIDSSSNNNSISRNTFIDCGLAGALYANSVVNNTVNGKPLVYLEDVVGYTVGDAGQVMLVGCDDITVEGLNLSNATIGVWLYETSNSIISQNNMTDDNISGINLGYSSSNSISGNNITNNDDGIGLTSSAGNSINGNIITNSPIAGISIFSSSSNSISGNNITNNYYGINLDDASNNSVYHNNFVNNTYQVFSDGSPNTWDNGYPSGGNYWSDYNGTDSYSGPYQNQIGSDGIGDTPYVIDANNTDNYPLMFPYPHLVGDLNGDGKVNLADLTLMAYAYGSHCANYDCQGEPASPNWNPDADLAAPFGIISLTDVTTLAMHYGQHNP